MKFAAIALTATASAGQVAFPTVSWNVDKVNAIKNDVAQYGQRAHTAKMADNEASLKSLSHAFASYKVGEYVIFGKYMKPIAEDNVAFFDELTIEGGCNEEIATDCVNSFLVGPGCTGGGPDKCAHEKMLVCVSEKAHCATNFYNLSAKDKQALADHYKTDIGNLENAYGALWERTGAEFKTAQKEH